MRQLIFSTADLEPDRIAGTLRIDDGAAGGGKIDLEFEATLRAEFQKAR